MVPLPRFLPLAVTALGVRWLHLLAATVAVGGSVLTWLRFRLATGDERDGRDAVRLARTYEWLFWGAVGTLVMTGVGNLGAFAPTLPGGGWRATLDLKLAVLTLVLVGSAVRVRLLARRGSRTRLLRRAYAATAVGLLVLLTLAEVLAHG
jgi:uncharacterized membrane protein